MGNALAELGRREFRVAEDDLVFVGESGCYLDGSALRRRYKAALDDAGLRPLRFHDLRHTLGTRMIAKADIRRVLGWMGQRTWSIEARVGLDPRSASVIRAGASRPRPRSPTARRCVRGSAPERGHQRRT
jgi:integrase